MGGNAISLENEESFEFEESVEAVLSYEIDTVDVEVSWGVSAPSFLEVRTCEALLDGYQTSSYHRLFKLFQKWLLGLY